MGSQRVGHDWATFTSLTRSRSRLKGLGAWNLFGRWCQEPSIREKIGRESRKEILINHIQLLLNRPFGGWEAEKCIPRLQGPIKVLWKCSRSVMPDPLRPCGLCSLPGSFVHGILQARILGWVVIPFSRGSSWPRDHTRASYIAADSLPSESLGKRGLMVWNSNCITILCLWIARVCKQMGFHGEKLVRVMGSWYRNNCRIHFKKLACLL